jgi:hypothetical protein
MRGTGGTQLNNLPPEIVATRPLFKRGQICGTCGTQSVRGLASLSGQSLNLLLSPIWYWCRLNRIDADCHKFGRRPPRGEIRAAKPTSLQGSSPGIINWRLQANALIQSGFPTKILISPEKRSSRPRCAKPPIRAQPRTLPFSGFAPSLLHSFTAIADNFPSPCYIHCRHWNASCTNAARDRSFTTDDQSRAALCFQECF